MDIAENYKDDSPIVVEPKVGEAWVLSKAADILEQYGWIQTHLYRGGRRCAIGAIHAAVDGQRHRVPMVGALREKSIRAFARWLAPDQPGSEHAQVDVVAWNDRRGRTKGEVIDALRKASASL